MKRRSDTVLRRLKSQGYTDEELCALRTFRKVETLTRDTLSMLEGDLAAEAGTILSCARRIRDLVHIQHDGPPQAYPQLLHDVIEQSLAENCQSMSEGRPSRTDDELGHSGRYAYEPALAGPLANGSMR